MKQPTNLFLLVCFIFSLNSSAQIVGNDKDKHGCIASAGYTFSRIKNSCIRVFEEPIQLQEIEQKGTAQFNAAVIFSANNEKAEIFLPNVAGSQILIRKRIKGTSIWKKGKLVLTQKNGYQLASSNKLIFSSSLK